MTELTIPRALTLINEGRQRRWLDLAEDTLRLNDLMAESNGQLSADDQRTADRLQRQIDDAKADLAVADQLVDLAMNALVKEPVSRALEAEAQTA